jgi:uncharacterized protein (DUF111 family)
LLSANLDDMTGEELSYLAERLLAEGALDAWHAPIIMKKGRPAVVTSALCHTGQVAALERVFFSHSSTLGVRRDAVSRTALPRETVPVDTRYGVIRVKHAAGKLHPEYEDCRRAAEASGISLREISRAAISAFHER